MTFLTYSSNIYDMLDELVDQLVLADATHFSKIDVGSNANKACVRFQGNGEDRYILFKAVRLASSIVYPNGNSSTSYYTYVVQVVIGAEWNATSYEPETSVQNYYAAMYFINNTTYDQTVFETRVYSHKIWLDANGFYWCCWNPYDSYTPSGFMMMMEFMPVSGKEYDDGGSSIIYQCYHGNQYTNSISYAYVPSAGVAYSYYCPGGSMTKFGQYGVFQTEYPLIDYNNVPRAFKSVGNNKVYFDFAKYHKSPPVYNNAFLNNKRTFFCQKNGLANNDILSWQDGEVTRKYLVCEVGSAGGILLDYIAIPYENAATYTIT